MFEFLSIQDEVLLNGTIYNGSLFLLVKYPNFKEITFMCGLPDKPWQVALIDQDKGNIMDVVDKRFYFTISELINKNCLAKKKKDMSSREIITLSLFSKF